MHASTDRVSLVDGAFHALHRHLRATGYRGYEFDDMLSSPVVRLLAGRSLLLQRIAIQAGRRSVVNLRPLLGVKRLESSKAYGFFAKGYLYHYMATGAQEDLALAERHLKWLRDHYCSDYSGMSWGNAFDFASRGGFIPRGMPTIVWTAHISEAFDLAYDVTKADVYRDVVVNVGRFIAENIPVAEDESGLCLGYTPAGLSDIHNSNLLGAVALLRAWRYSGNLKYYALGKKAVAWSCSRMNSDGSWYYGDRQRYRWIDNFHTAYNLDCLVAAQNIGGHSVCGQSVIEQTYRYWVSRFFATGGRPRYYHDREYPVDIQCCSQAVESLSKYSARESQALNLAMAVASWTLRNMQKAGGGFRFRRGRVFSNEMESIHWGQSTMLSALGCLLWRLGVPQGTADRIQGHVGGFSQGVLTGPAS